MKTVLRRTLWGFGGALALLALFHLIENGRGRHAWTTWQREREAVGDRLDLASYVPPPVPDAENFATSPRVAAAIKGAQPLLTPPPGWPNASSGWREGRRVDLGAFRAASPDGDLSKTLSAYGAVLDELVTASRRPACRLPVDYSRLPDLDIPDLLGFRAAARMLQLRALVALDEGRGEAAFEDVSALLRMTRHFEQEPLLLCQLLRMALASIAIQPLYEGLQTHAWTEPQLASLRDELARVDVLTSLRRSWKSEQIGLGAVYLRVAAEQPWEWTHYPRSDSDAGKPSRLGSLLRHLLIPRGWILQNAVRTSRATQQVVCDPLDPATHCIDPARQEAALKATTQEGRTPYTFLASDLVPALAAQNLRAAWLQAGVLQARIACDLERHRRARGGYPARLSELGVALPGDVIGGQPMHYRPAPDGGYLLYSLGWNGVDDGGQTSPDPSHREGDWTWTIRGTRAAAKAR